MNVFDLLDESLKCPACGQEAPTNLSEPHVLFSSVQDIIETPENCMNCDGQNGKAEAYCFNCLSTPILCRTCVERHFLVCIEFFEIVLIF